MCGMGMAGAGAVAGPPVMAAKQCMRSELVAVSLPLGVLVGESVWCGVVWCEVVWTACIPRQGVEQL